MSRELLAKQGCFFLELRLSPAIRRSIEARDWVSLDRELKAETSRGGVIFEALSAYAPFSEIEFIISIRSSKVEPDEDGIWHDDGSRMLAFSLSLTPEHSDIAGGRLEIRKRGADTSDSIATPPYGTMIVFATGQSGFEHKINRVTAGERIIAAGWCT